MSHLLHNLLPILIAFCGSYVAWMYGGSRPYTYLSFAPWLWVLLLEGLLFFPQKRERENSRQARERVWYNLRHDPLCFLVLGFLVILAFAFVNKGLCPNCDAAAIAAGADPSPIFPILPFTVNRFEHFDVFCWFATALTAALAAKHGLNDRGKRLVISLMVLNAVLLGLLGLVQLVTGAEGVYWHRVRVHQIIFFASFGYVNHAAAYFTILFALSLAVWRHKTCSPLDWTILPPIILFITAFATLSRSAIVLTSLIAVLAMLHALISAFSKMTKLKRVKTAAVGLLVLIALVLSVIVLTPTSVRKELSTLDSTVVLQRVSGKGQYHDEAARSVLSEFPFFGCGGWGYKHFSLKYTPKEVRRFFGYEWSQGGANVHNDSLQFMVEHGLIGFGLLVAIVVLLLLPLGRTWRQLAQAVRFLPKAQMPPFPPAFFALPGSAFMALLAFLAPVLHSFADCPFRSPAVVYLFFTLLACLEGYLPIRPGALKRG